MTFYQKLEALCEREGTTVTSLAATLGFSNSAGTTWKKSKGFPRNSTLKKIADHFGISVSELKKGVEVPINYDDVDTDSFNAPVWQHLLELCNGDERRAIDRYLAFETAQMEDAMQDSAYARASTSTLNGALRELSEQSAALLETFEKLNIIDQAKVLAYAAELAKR